jgi:Tfp pilus assembly protein PilZ
VGPNPGPDDENHLRHASNDGRVLYSFNIRDYSLLHEQWIASGREHSGIILASQQRYSIGEQLRRLLHLLNRKPAADMLCRLEYLFTWRR